MNITKKMLEEELQGLTVLKDKLADAYNKNLGAIEAITKMLNTMGAPEPKSVPKGKPIPKRKPKKEMN